MKIRGNVMLDKQKLQDFANVVVKYMEKLHSRLDTDDLMYPIAVRNPFDPQIKGIRIPQLVPDATITYCAYDEETINIAAGETMLMFGSFTVP